MLRPVTDASASTRVRDVALAWERLKTSPRLTLSAVAAFAAAMMSYAALFMMVDAMVSRASQTVVHPEQVVRVYSLYQGNLMPVSMALYESLRLRADAFEELAAFGRANATVQLTPYKIRRVEVMAVSGSYFDLLGTPPALGRYFSRAEDQPLEAGTDVAVVSTGFWQMTLGGKSDAIGTRMLVAGRMFLVVGVAAAAFPGHGLQSADVWIPMNRGYRFAWDSSSDATAPNFWLLGRVRPNLSLAEAEVSASRAYQGVTRGTALARYSTGMAVRPLAVASRWEWAGWISGLGLSMLIVTGAALANLLLLRVVQPRKDAALRAVLGAGQRSPVLLLAWDVGAMLLASICLAAPVVAMARAGLEDLALANPLGAGTAVRMLGFVAVAATFAGALISILPALRAVDATGDDEGPHFTRLFPERAVEDVPIVDWTAGLHVMKDKDRNEGHWTGGPGAGTAVIGEVSA